ncbi:MAG: hypothetical protein GC160_22485 [Acidobacteria bacterium]|nr:hypothetical protein [Acidobacteriota bacterium]
MFKVWTERELPADLAAEFDGLATIVGPPPEDPAERYRDLPGAHAIVAAGGTFGADVLDRSSEMLVVSRTGIGYDKVDVEAASARHIAVCNTPDGPTISTAEFALALLLATAKKLKLAEGQLRRFPDGRDFYKEHDAIELYGLTLGLVGLGRIGRHVGKVALAMGMKVVAYDPFVSAKAAAQLGIESIPSLDDLLGRADVVSLHLPLTADTRHLISAEKLALMKPGALFINASRGGLVDEPALIAALEAGRLGGVGLDVTDPEPPLPINPMLAREDVVLTPHVGSATAAGKHRILSATVANIVSVLKGELPQDMVNFAIWPDVQRRWAAMR